MATNTITRVAIYARVSTKDKGQEVENQLRQLRDFAALQGWAISREYIDHETAKTDDRAEFQSMFGDASQRKFSVLLFWALDRLSREGVLETLQHLNRLTSYGVGYRSFTEQYFDSCGIFKDAVIAIVATVAKQERVRISERVKAGLETARANGKRLGRPRVAVDGARIGRLRAQGLSWAKIAAELGIGEGTAYRLAHTSAKNPIGGALVSPCAVAADRASFCPPKSGDFGTNSPLLCDLIIHLKFTCSALPSRQECARVRGTTAQLQAKGAQAGWSGSAKPVPSRKERPA